MKYYALLRQRKSHSDYPNPLRHTCFSVRDDQSFEEVLREHTKDCEYFDYCEISREAYIRFYD